MELEDITGIPNVSRGFHIFKDGNMWCAVGPSFRNLQEDRAGFGESPQKAFDDWWESNKNDRDFRAIVNIMPNISSFKVHI